MQDQSIARTDDFLQTLTTVAAETLTAYPHAICRITKALDLVVDGHVTLLSDGVATVRSQTGTAIYRVTQGHCECPDRRAAICKHRWAVMFLLHTTRRLQPYFYRRRGWHYAPVRTMTRLQVEADIHESYNGQSSAQLALLDAGGVVSTRHARYASDPTQLPPPVRRLQAGRD